MNSSRFLWHLAGFALFTMYCLSTVGEESEASVFSVGDAFAVALVGIAVYTLGFMFGHSLGKDDGYRSR